MKPTEMRTMMATSHEEALRPAETLVGISFTDPFRSKEFLLAASGLANRNAFKLKDAVVISKNDHGKTAVVETVDLPTGRTAMSAAMWAGLFGLIVGGPVGWLAGVAVGASLGAAAANYVDIGIRDEWVDWFRVAADPGTVIVALLVTNLDRDALITEVGRFPGARLVYANLEIDTLDRLKESPAPAPRRTSHRTNSRAASWITRGVRNLSPVAAATSTCCQSAGRRSAVDQIAHRTSIGWKSSRTALRVSESSPNASRWCTYCAMLPGKTATKNAPTTHPIHRLRIVSNEMPRAISTTPDNTTTVSALSGTNSGT